MALTDTAIRTRKPATKPIKLADGGGLYLLLQPNGARWWRLDYRFNGKRKTVSMGVYPDTGLADARTKRDTARKLLAQGVDPGAHRKAAKAAGEESASNSFETVAREWLANKAHAWTASHLGKQEGRLSKHAFPWIGKRPIAELGVTDLRPLLDRMVKLDHHEQAHRVMAAMSSVFKHAVATGRAERDPAGDLSAALPPLRQQHFATITDPAMVGGLLRAIDGFNGTFPVACALRLAPLTFVRPGELRGARWSEIDLAHPEGPQWAIPAARQKLRRADKESPRTPPFIVPLSTQAVAIIEELRPLTGHREHLFPGGRDPKRPMSDAAINAALRRMGFDKETMTGHGFRHMASTLLNELGFSGDAIERQLAHKEAGVRGVYNQAKHLPERRRMMQAWADYLDALRTNTGKVIPFKHKAA